MCDAVDTTRNTMTVPAAHWQRFAVKRDTPFLSDHSLQLHGLEDLQHARLFYGMHVCYLDCIALHVYVLECMSDEVHMSTYLPLLVPIGIPLSTLIRTRSRFCCLVGLEETGHENLFETSFALCDVCVCIKHGLPHLCRQLNGLRQQSKLADEAATEAAAEAAKLQKRNDDLSQKLQDMEQKHNSTTHKAAADTHRQQMLVGPVHTMKPNTMKHPIILHDQCMWA